MQSKGLDFSLKFDMNNIRKRQIKEVENTVVTGTELTIKIKV